MILPLQVSFRNMKPSDAVDARIREEIVKLEKFYQSIMRCRVVVGLPHKHRRKGDPYHVRIDLTVPAGLHSTKRWVRKARRRARLNQLDKVILVGRCRQLQKRKGGRNEIEINT